jgi:hypothetical protein
METPQTKRTIDSLRQLIGQAEFQCDNAPERTGKCFDTLEGEAAYIQLLDGVRSSVSELVGAWKETSGAYYLRYHDDLRRSLTLAQHTLDLLGDHLLEERMDLEQAAHEKRKR